MTTHIFSKLDRNIIRILSCNVDYLMIIIYEIYKKLYKKKNMFEN